MTERTPFLILVLLLVAAGLATATFRQQAYGIPWMPGEETRVWQVEARIEFTAVGGASQVFLALPPPQSGYQLVTESGASSGWGFTLEESRDGRRAHWTRREASGNQVLFYNLDFVVNPSLVSVGSSPAPVEPLFWDEPYQTAVSDVLATLMPITADAHSMTEQLIQTLRRSPADQNVNLLTSAFGRVDLMTRILRTAGIPARSVQVLELEDNRRRQALVEFVQVWDDDRWRLYEPSTGLVARRDNLLLWQTGAPGVLEVVGGENSRATFSIISQNRSTLELAEDRAESIALSLYSLPIAEQGMFKLIMLLPVGALVVVLLRVLVGIRTSGTFMPVLIALAFLQTDLVPGVTIFVVVVAIGLTIRSYLSALNLLLVARIAALVVIVIGIISIFAIVSYRLGLIQGLTITFFPMIILAWTIERMSITWEEEGPREVLIQGGGSLLVAVIAFLLMDLSFVRHLAFNFPELHMSLLGVMLLAGRYTGYRLLELKRFGAFQE
jgi:hypothetical protein